MKSENIIEINENKRSGVFTVKIVCNHGIAAALLKVFKEIFEMEYLTAKIVRSKGRTSMTLKTTNREKCALVEKGLIASFPELSGLNNVNPN